VACEKVKPTRCEEINRRLKNLELITNLYISRFIYIPLPKTGNLVSGCRGIGQPAVRSNADV